MTTATEGARPQPRHVCALALAAGLLAPLPCTADTGEAARLLADLREAHPGTQFTEVATTEIPGIYEVWMRANVAYVAAANPRIFLFGRLFDTHGMRDLTAQKLALRGPDSDAKSNTAAESTSPGIAFDRLPLADAITVRRGGGHRQIVVFSDPNCVHCKQLEVELAALDDVTVHTFVVPFQGEARPIAIWCAADRRRAWHDWMLKGDASGVQTGRTCDNPITRNLQLARSLRVQGTPTLFWADGTRTDGYVDRAVLEARLLSTRSAGSQLSAPTSALPERRP